jgi:hypothetical protein
MMNLHVSRRIGLHLQLLVHKADAVGYLPSRRVEGRILGNIAPFEAKQNTAAG